MITRFHLDIAKEHENYLKRFQKTNRTRVWDMKNILKKVVFRSREQSDRNTLKQCLDE